MGGKPRPKFDPGKPHRIQVDPGGSFDELVVGDWFHMERMDNDWWWMRIGQTTYACIVRKDGTVEFKDQDDIMPGGLKTRIQKAVLASEEGSCKDAIQDMLAILDPDGRLFEGVSEAQIQAMKDSL